ncbi:hypothetical protein SDC9_142265 [bioreactor metagenome]|uniref:Uncharacterized protein n=1 Tax=bioreactor metagenome TaxID=1076179 RepID=A0A645E004_9ZZZZ
MHHDALLARPDGFTNADLLGALGDGNQHDVHDADAADEERDCRNAAKQQRKRARDGAHRIRDAAHVHEPEGVLILMEPREHKAIDLTLRVVRVACGGNRQRRDIRLIRHAGFDRERRIGGVSADHRGEERFILLQNTDDEEIAPAYGDLFTNRVCFAKQLFRCVVGKHRHIGSILHVRTLEEATVFQFQPLYIIICRGCAIQGNRHVRITEFCGGVHAAGRGGIANCAEGCNLVEILQPNRRTLVVPHVDGDHVVA